MYNITNYQKKNEEQIHKHTNYWTRHFNTNTEFSTHTKLFLQILNEKLVILIFFNNNQFITPF